MRILVVGGAGGCGRHCLTQGSERGHAMRVLTPMPGRLAAVRDVHVLAGDVRDADIVARAVADQDAVVVSLGMLPTWRRVTLFSRGIGNVIAAMQAAGVTRLIYLTGVGAGDSRGHGGFWFDNLVQPLLLREIYADKDASEVLVRASGLQWTIVRPALLTNGSTTARYRILSQLQHIVASSIARGDVAHFVLDELERNEFVGAAPLLTY